MPPVSNAVGSPNVRVRADPRVVVSPDGLRRAGSDAQDMNIVVGVDGSDGSKRALRWAAEEARARGGRLTLVRAWYPSASLYGFGFGLIDAEAVSDLRILAQKQLEEICTENADILDGIDVDCRVVEDLAANALLEAARDADLLVVGTRGHGGFAGLLLGSVSAHCAHHTPCPLVIVPPANR